MSRDVTSVATGSSTYKYTTPYPNASQGLVKNQNAMSEITQTPR